ncbi:hypothetical protein QI060_00245 [Staphylococcus saprophyticus]|uniref:Uncharacterized protein n=1 Tax=uncultured Caudovirales phage TaxID=2100421 RepID=A0A2H4JI03_9CAUD|nr:hypothetical protein 10F4_12 [uncultured Caudovirales phage]MDW4300735.1 hypothetical protein [Staphylococcus saprophyticus]
MAYEYEGYIKNTIRTEAVFNHEKEKRQERVKELQEVYFKAEILNRIIGIVKNGRSLGSDTDSEIILRAIEHELKYTEDK